MTCTNQDKKKYLLIAPLLGAIVIFGTLLYAAEGQGVAADPGSNATWSGKGGKESGRENYMAYCAVCHGQKGKGDGDLAASLGDDIHPRDLTDKDILSTRTDAELFKVIKEGGAAAGFSDAMPAQGGVMLTDEEIKNLILFIRADLCKCKGK